MHSARKPLWAASLIFLVLLSMAAGDRLYAAEEGGKQPVELSLAGGAMTLTAPGDWVKKQPRINFIAYEFALPAAEGDETDGRLTISQAGGSVQVNIDRWISQFKQPEGVKPVIGEQKIAGQTVHTVDLSGTYAEFRGPRVGTVQRENYRMLGAIVVTAEHGQHFIKLYGPRKTVAAHEKEFEKFLGSLKVKEK